MEYSKDDLKQYLLYSKLKTHKRKVKQALEIAKTGVDCGPEQSMSFSAGKDSVVMLDIAIKSGFKGTLVYFYYSEFENPQENIELVKYYATLHNLEYKIIKSYSCKEMWDELGYFTTNIETEKEQRLWKRTDQEFRENSKTFLEENKIDVNFIGMRKKESNTRRISLSIKGDLYTTKDRPGHTCCPISNFDNIDIWAYIVSNNLKYLDIYDYAYIDRKEIRNEINWLAKGAIAGLGTHEHYKNMYPAIIRKLERTYKTHY